MAHILVVGEPLILFTASEEGELHTIDCYTRSAAGAELNVAIGLTRLGHEVSYGSKLGNDSFGRYLSTFLEQQKIHTSWITVDNKYQTGFQVKEKVSQGDPQVIHYRKGSAASHLQIKDAECIALEAVELLHVTGIFPALSQDTLETTRYLMKKVKQKGIKISFDPNIRPSLWESEEVMVRTINEFAFQSDIVLPGIGEGKILTSYSNEKDIAQFYLSQGVKQVVVKLGERGAYVATQTEGFYVPGYQVERVVDTVGAGDGFAVGYISGTLEGLSISECGKRANAIGALQVMHQGDNEGLPTKQRLKEFMNQNH